MTNPKNADPLTQGARKGVDGDALARRSLPSGGRVSKRKPCARCGAKPRRLYGGMCFDCRDRQLNRLRCIQPTQADNFRHTPSTTYYGGLAIQHNGGRQAGHVPGTKDEHQ